MARLRIKIVATTKTVAMVEIPEGQQPVRSSDSQSKRSQVLKMVKRFRCHTASRDGRLCLCVAFVVMIAVSAFIYRSLA